MQQAETARAARRLRRLRKMTCHVVFSSAGVPRKAYNMEGFSCLLVEEEGPPMSFARKSLPCYMMFDFLYEK